MKAILATFLLLQLVILNDGLRNCPASKELKALRKALDLTKESRRVPSTGVHRRQKRGVSMQALKSENKL
jgi:hypothetical protein